MTRKLKLQFRSNYMYMSRALENLGGCVVYQFYIFRAQEPKAPVTYCDHALSGVRPSSVRRPSSVKLFTFSTSSPEPLDGF